MAQLSLPPIFPTLILFFWIILAKEFLIDVRSTVYLHYLFAEEDGKKREIEEKNEVFIVL